MQVYRFGVTGGNESRVAYPRSVPVRATLTPSEYNFLACAADVSDSSLLSGARGSLRRLAKAYLEHDRALWAAEAGYEAHVTRMHNPAASPKADILFGWRAEAPPEPDVRALLSVCVLCVRLATTPQPVPPPLLLLGVADERKPHSCGRDLPACAPRYPKSHPTALAPRRATPVFQPPLKRPHADARRRRHARRPVPALRGR